MKLVLRIDLSQGFTLAVGVLYVRTTAIDHSLFSRAFDGLVFPG